MKAARSIAGLIVAALTAAALFNVWRWLEAFYRETESHDDQSVRYEDEGNVQQDVGLLGRYDPDFYQP